MSKRSHNLFYLFREMDHPTSSWITTSERFRKSRISVNYSPDRTVSLSEHTAGARITQLQVQVESLKMELQQQRSRHRYALAHATEQLRVATAQLQATEKRAEKAEARLLRIQDNTMLLRDLNKRFRKFEQTVIPLHVNPQTRFTVFEIQSEKEEYLDPGALYEGSNVTDDDVPLKC